MVNENKDCCRRIIVQFVFEFHYTIIYYNGGCYGPKIKNQSSIFNFLEREHFLKLHLFFFPNFMKNISNFDEKKNYIISNVIYFTLMHACIPYHLSHVNPTLLINPCIYLVSLVLIKKSQRLNQNPKIRFIIVLNKRCRIKI
ncbi:hypothetical protein BpHYR1_036615 [Brachionus plicatilis]|uniref:Uncharacterized protein n=1 Tax=Brachionus plicatilis TaxID=10195 RepID=A0A3M7SGR9_BRAPC|nr:hypothetical protein BpHYR1_036615 [Brachionus plicatilis]